MNEITNHGNLTDEPALHHSPSGVAVLTFSVAVNGRRFNRQTNRWVDKAPVFPQVGAFNGLAENANATLVKAPPSPASLSTTPGSPSRVVRSGAASCQPGTNTAALLSYSGHTSVFLPCTAGQTPPSARPKRCRSGWALRCRWPVPGPGRRATG